MGTYESERIDGNKQSTKYEEENKRKREKGVKTLLFYFSTGSLTCMCLCAGIRVFGAVFYKPSVFYEPFFIRQHL